MLSMRDWGRDCICPSGKDNVCGRRFDRQFGTLAPGYDHKYVYSEFGYNLKPTDMQAAIGCAQLEKLPGFVTARRHNHALLADRLAPLADRLELPVATPGSEPSWFGYLITVRPDAGFSRDDITGQLEARGVQTRTLFAGNLIRQPCFDDMRATGKGYRVIGELPVTDRIMTDSFWIGVYPGMTEEMLEHMVSTISSACGV
jgi:CDP-4-dehydro-6-deoxyglucose reductase, E1